MSDYQQDSASQTGDYGGDQNAQGGYGQDQSQGMTPQDGGYGQDLSMSDQGSFGQDQSMSDQGGFGQDQGMSGQGAQGGYSQDQGMGQAGQGAGAQGGLGGLMGRAEEMLQGSSDPRAQQAEGLLNQARGILGGSGGSDAPADTQSTDGDGSTFGVGQ